MDDNEWFCAVRNPFEPKPFWIEGRRFRTPAPFSRFPPSTPCASSLSFVLRSRPPGARPCPQRERFSVYHVPEPAAVNKSSVAPLPPVFSPWWGS